MLKDVIDGLEPQKMVQNYRRKCATEWFLATKVTVKAQLLVTILKLHSREIT